MIDTTANNLLYHYTSEAGLQGIICNNVIWATDVRFLNDWTEFQQLFKEVAVKRLLDAYIEGLPKDVDEDAKRVVIDGMFAERNLEKLLSIIESRPPYGESSEAFVASFSADGGDRLSQWRGYSNSRQGFSLGFDPKLLEKQIASSNTPEIPAELVECIYDEPSMMQRLTELGRAAGGQFSELMRKRECVPEFFRTDLPNASPQYLSTCWYLLKALTGATSFFLRAAARFKHPGFSEESETRIVCFALRRTLARMNRIKFRNGPFGLTPYIEIPIGLQKPETCALRRIVVGPGPRSQKERETTLTSIQMLLEQYSIPLRSPTTPNGTEIVVSGIPFRPQMFS